ncbi:MAG TPA: response regulator [Candidatus Dormibacteraeota bacterium]|nr:response regulator [Candidatus Dormibacteraeota bacterium]
MSELMPFPAVPETRAETKPDSPAGPQAGAPPETKRTPTVYFIDDSATMREVIKIAFRRENVNVIACADAASALAQFEQNRPDVVITDVIMPDQDGYSVCSHIKQHPDLSGVPVVLMSGVVNKSVADKAVAVRADELVRKPFQPQELINRVKALLDPKGTPAPQTNQERSAGSNALNNLFAPQPRAAFLPNRSGGSLDPSAQPPANAPQQPESAQTAQTAWTRSLAEAFTPRQQQPNAPQPNHSTNPGQSPFAQQPPQAQRPPASPADVQKLRMEIAHLDLLIKKLQTELQIERQYNQALESQIRAITEST